MRDSIGVFSRVLRDFMDNNTITGINKRKLIVIKKKSQKALKTSIPNVSDIEYLSLLTKND